MAQVRKADGLGAGTTYLFYELESAAVPLETHPQALLHLVPGLDRARLGLLVYLHGFDNCIENVVRAAPGTCEHGGAVCPSADLIGHLERSGRNALLLCPEVQFHARTSDPGAFAQPAALRRLLGEVFALLGDELPAAPEDLRHTVLASHSGGYRAAALLATEGGAPVQELFLLDSLYGEEERFERFLQEGGRLVNLYTEGGGTAARSRALEQRGRAQGWIAEGRLVSTQVPTGHSDIPGAHLGQLLRESGLPAIVSSSTGTSP